MAIASVLTITLTMLILGLFAALLVNLNYIASHVESEIEITAYLHNSVTQDMMPQIRTTILQIPGVLQADFVSREEAMERLNARMGDRDLLRGWGGTNNPLPDSYVVRAQRPDQIPAIAASLHQMAEVEEVHYGHGFVQQLLNLTSLVRIFGIMVMAGLGAAALFIVANTIRLTVIARRREIEIMRYVGATSAFIRIPFLLEGLVLGVMGSGAAYWLISQAYYAAEAYFRREMLFITLASAESFMLDFRLWVFAVGSLFGLIGSSISIGRYLRV